MRPKTTESSFLPKGRLEFTWKTLLLGYSNKPMTKQRPDIQGVDLEMASSKHEVHVWEKKKLLFIFKYLHYRYIRVMLTSMHSSNKNNLQFITRKS